MAITIPPAQQANATAISIALATVAAPNSTYRTAARIMSRALSSYSRPQAELAADIIEQAVMRLEPARQLAALTGDSSAVPGQMPQGSGLVVTLAFVFGAVMMVLSNMAGSMFGAGPPGHAAAVRVMKDKAAAEERANAMWEAAAAEGKQQQQQQGKARGSAGGKKQQ